MEGYQSHTASTTAEKKNEDFKKAEHFRKPHTNRC